MSRAGPTDSASRVGVARLGQFILGSFSSTLCVAEFPAEEPQPRAVPAGGYIGPSVLLFVR